MPYFSPSRRAAARLMMAWQSGTDFSWLFRLWPFTGNLPSLGMNSSRGVFSTPWNSSSKLLASQQASRRSTRSPVRSQRLAMAMASQSP